MTPEQAEEILTLLRNLDGRMEAVEARLSNLEVDQKVIRTSLQEQGNQIGLILQTQANYVNEVVKVVEPEDLFQEDTLDDPERKL